MINLYTISSDHSKMPIAEIRTDGTNIDWIVDNSSGKLKSTCSGNFKQLQDFVNKSSHLKMTPTENHSLGILRYSLVNGDVVEITTDGKTALINGKIIDEAHKNALMNAIVTGSIQVKNKADLGRPIPIYTTHPKEKKAVQAQESSPPNGLLEAFRVSKKKQDQRDSLNNRQYDRKIEEVEFDPQNDPAMGKRLLYLLKYGDSSDE